MSQTSPNRRDWPARRQAQLDSERVEPFVDVSAFFAVIADIRRSLAARRSDANEPIAVLRQMPVIIGELLCRSLSHCFFGDILLFARVTVDNKCS